MLHLNRITIHAEQLLNRVVARWLLLMILGTQPKVKLESTLKTCSSPKVEAPCCCNVYFMLIEITSNKQQQEELNAVALAKNAT